MQSTLTQLFWPLSRLNHEGYIIGWPIRGFTCCIIDISKQSFSALSSSIHSLGERVEILGIIGKEFEPIGAKTQSDIWITAENRENSIWITELYCCNYKYKGAAHIIFFDDTKPSDFICPSIFQREIFNYSMKLKKSELSTFQIVCEKINRTQFARERLKKAMYNGVNEKRLVRNKDGWVARFCGTMKDFTEVCYLVYCFKLPLLRVSIRDLPFRSKFIQQLVSRLLLFRIWESNRKHFKPSCASPYLLRSYANSSIRSKSAIYTILADFVLGLIVLLVLNYFSTDTLMVVHTLGSTIHIEVLKSEVNWLMGLPAGFKPNEALDNALGSNILILINFWNYVTTYLTRFEAEIVQFFAVFGLFGISFQLALLSDLIDFCTLHIHYIYVLVGKIYYWQVRSIFSLCRLIIGLKKNVLKNVKIIKRIDKGKFEIDEILLGALIVTGLTFLYPTIAMYYLCFVSIWLSVQLLQLGIMCLLVGVNYVPIYLVFAYFLEPGLFVKSVCFEVIEQQANLEFPTNYLNMKRQNHSFLSIFSGFLCKLQAQISELFNFSIVKHIVIGTRIPRTKCYESKY